MQPIIGAFGYSGTPSEKQKKLARAVGKAIAKQHGTLLTGATTGIPHEAAKGAKANNGLVIGISPANNKEEHKKIGMPLADHDAILYTGFGYQGRNVINARSCDAAIIIGGSVGSLNEFTISYANNKIIGVLQGSGGITDIIETIVEKMDKRYTPTIIYDKDPVLLVKKIFAALKKRST